jgi:hypothetical protein
MKAKLKGILAMIAVCLALVSNTVPTWAGMVLAPEVTIIFDDFLYVTGSMAGARYSKDNNQNIGCTAYTFPSYSWTACFATDKTGKSVVCGNGDPRLASTVQAMTDSSHLYFSLPNGNGGECGTITVWNESYLLK